MLWSILPVAYQLRGDMACQLYGNGIETHYNSGFTPGIH